jgi:serine/threonine protein phosphatase PrpC
VITEAFLAREHHLSVAPDRGAALSAIAATATLSLKTVNQDACAVIDDVSSGIAGVIVADGIGSHFRSELASSAACSALKDALSIRRPAGAPDLEESFGTVSARLRDDFGSLVASLPDGVTPSDAYGTTLLFAGLSSSAMHMGYVGNGAIFHVRGDFADFPPSRILPWTSLNYVNPHTSWVDGSPALHKWVSPSGDAAQAKPTVMAVTRDLELRGDILIVCSDGVYSYDQAPVGLDSSGRPWISGEESMQLMYAELATFCRSGDLTARALQQMLDRYLATLCERDLVNDDCTVGIVISDTALRYHERRAGTRK